MMFTILPPDETDTPDLKRESEPEAIIDLAAQRELRVLRAKVGDLEGRLANALDRAVPAIRPSSMGEEKHTISTCGYHPQVTVGEKTPKVWCRHCGEELSAIDVLREFARRERNFTYNLDEAKQTLIERKAEIEKLTKIRNNLRAQIKRARDTQRKLAVDDLPDEPDTHGA